ncbi:hypothetical protein H696_04507 [Fonticula alba]|uniref:NADPH-dependent diflavin oxidoreductase 1 n=1 Tax=Fonticula alba TaxID=691883 RepID=A0A058Z6E0_FONAL|nr:hypothetical protein H696_04507 [Fonticula alba]KCV69092.1 hypothetical protein H696_04507 [Fonticula alba]|eukprot:XP_009496663.1 hypothetical protein H696_04507 [Fonticula alba]
MSASDDTLLILYGSQTGTAAAHATRLAMAGRRLCRQAGRPADRISLRSLEHFDMDTLPAHPRVAIVMATTGAGEFPVPSRAAWRRLLRASLPRTWLAARGTRISVLGLGDSSYKEFNFAAKKLARRLAQLGARSIDPATDVASATCLDARAGDDEQEATFDAWALGIFKSMGLVPGTEDGSGTSAGWVDPARRVVALFGDSMSDFAPDAGAPPLARPADEHASLVLCSNRVIAGTVPDALDLRAEGEVRELILALRTLPATPLQAGDALALWPRNPADAVAQALDALGIPPGHGDRLVSLLALEEGDSLEDLFECHLLEGCPLSGLTRTRPVPLREFLARALDLNSAPSPGALARMAGRTRSAQERDRLAEFAPLAIRRRFGLEEMPLDPRVIERNEYNAYIRRGRRTALEVVADFFGCRLSERSLARPVVGELLLQAGQPRLTASQLEGLSLSGSEPHRPAVTGAPSGTGFHWEDILAPGGLFSPMQPRVYSIASDPEQTNAISLIARVVHYSTADADRGGPLKPRVGTCTRWLASLEAGDSLRYAPVPGSMKLPAPGAALPPLVFVATGTGLAPFRAYLQQLLRRVPAPQLPPILLVLGFRRRVEALCLADLLRPVARASSAGTGGGVWCAFSRPDSEAGEQAVGRLLADAPGPDEWEFSPAPGTGGSPVAAPPAGGRRFYVQDLLAEYRPVANLVASWLLERDARLFICGNGARLSDMVQMAVARALVTAGAPDDFIPTPKQLDQGMDRVRGLVKQGRIQSEAWVAS